MALSTSNLVTQLQLRARACYLKAQSNPVIAKRTLKAGGAADRALNYVLGFYTQWQRLFYLQATSSAEVEKTFQPLSPIVKLLFKNVAAEIAGTAVFAGTEILALIKEGAKWAYGEAQEITFIGTRFSKEGSRLDQKLNEVLGFGSQLERLEFLRDRMMTRGALKVIAWLEKVDKGEISDPPRIPNQTVLWAIVKKINQIQFKALLKKSLEQFQPYSLPVYPLPFSIPKFTPISEADLLRGFRLPKVDLPDLAKKPHGLPGKKD